MSKVELREGARTRDRMMVQSSAFNGALMILLDQRRNATATVAMAAPTMARTSTTKDRSSLMWAIWYSNELSLIKSAELVAMTHDARVCVAEQLDQVSRHTCQYRAFKEASTPSPL